MKIIRGKQPSAKKIVVYGPEGIGKSTFASRFPDPVFIDTEGSTKDMDVARFEAPSSWQMILEQVRYVKAHPEICRTLVLDTADWAEMRCIDHICARYHKDGLEEFGYGKGYTYAQEEFGRLLNLLEEVVGLGIHVVMTAHAKMRKFEQPDELGAYDRWEMKLTKQTAPMVKEWADMVLFANYKTFVVNVDGQGAQKGKNKAQGGKRVMFTTHHPCWDAKNRYGLPEELSFDYREIASILAISEGAPAVPEETPSPPRKGPEKPSEAAAEPSDQNPDLPPFMRQETMREEARPKEETSSRADPSQEKRAERMPDPPGRQAADTPPAPMAPRSLPENIPKALRDLMEANGVDEWDIQNVVAARGYYPADTPIQAYDPDFIDGVLVGAWGQVYRMIREMKEKEAIPFN